MTKLDKAVNVSVIVWMVLSVASMVMFGVWGVTWWRPLDPLNSFVESLLRLIFLFVLHVAPWVAGALAFKGE